MKRMFAVTKSADAAGEVTIYLYDELGADFWNPNAITAREIAAQLAEAGKVSAINVRINSPGGDVFEGLAIYNLLRTQGAPVNVMVDGLAASAASIVAMAGDKIVMSDGALMMIHNPWTIAAGSAADFRKTADTLDKIGGVLRDVYANRSGGKPEAIQAQMDAETWLTAQEAVDAGLATEIFSGEGDGDAAAQAARAFRIESRFLHVPGSLIQRAAARWEPEPAGDVPMAEPATPAFDNSMRARELELIQLV